MATTGITIPQEWRHDEGDIQEIIPKAVTLFHETSKHQEKVEVLTFLCHGLAPKLSLSLLEKTLLCHVFPNLPLCVDKVFLELEDIIHLDDELGQHNASNKSEILHDLLLVVLTILKCIETCVKHIYETFECISIHQVHSLPVPVLLIVKSTFSHCQKSEATYGELFSDLAQDLSLLFRKSFELQKLLLELMCTRIETLTSSNSEKDLRNITSVCENLLDICAITERFDGNMTPGMWKSLMRLVMKNKDVIKNHLQSDRIVSQMCSTLEGKLQNYGKLVDSSTPSDAMSDSSAKLLKVLKFLIKLLMSFLQSFRDFLLMSSFKAIVRLIYTVISLSTLTKPSSGLMALEDTGTSLLIVVEPFLKILVLSKKFADSLTRLKQEILPKNNFARCYTLANIIILLPIISEEMSWYWIKPENFSEDEPRASVYEALLDSCDHCFLQMSLPVRLPGTMCNGKTQRMVSFYEYVVSRLSASTSAIPSQLFHVIEKVLLKSIFSSSVISSSIATDVWCFMARWMTADLCYSHVKLFLNWLSTVSWKSEIQRNRLCSLVRRLLPLVAQEHQELLVQDYPVSLDNMEIWSIIPVHKMVESVRMKVLPKIGQLAKPVLEQWLNKTRSRPHLILVTNSATLDSLPKEIKSDLVLIILRFLDAFVDVSKEIPKKCWHGLLEILKAFLPLMPSQNFNKIMGNVSKAVDLFKDDVLSIYIARLMAECGRLSFPVGQNESALISKIFRTLVTSSHWLVHNEAFSALKRFAEVTPYTPVLEECVSEEMKEDFQKFICAIPFGNCDGEDQNAMVLNFLREQATLQRPKEKTESCGAPEHTIDKELEKRKRETTDGETDAKRAKLEIHQISKEDKEISTSSVEEISKHLVKLQEIHSRNSQLPPEVWEKLKTMKTLLDAMVKSD